MKTAAKLYRFGHMELDLKRYELRRNGYRLRLSRIPMELLILFIERRGQLITREEIVERLWSEPNSIDVIQGVNSAVKRIRALLDDDPAKPRFIETVVGKGYRFISDVEEVADETSPDPPSSQFQAGENTVLPLAVLKFPLLDPAENQTRKQAQHPWRPRVAFLYGAVAVLLAGSGLLYLAAHKKSKDTAFTFAQITTNENDNPVLATAIRDDGTALVYSDVNGLYLRDSSGIARPLHVPEKFSTLSLNWFPRSSHLLVNGVASDSQKNQIWNVSLDGSSPRLVEDRARNGVPSSDGAKIAFTNEAETEVFVAKPDGSNVTRVLSGSGYDTFPLLLWSSAGNLQFERRHFQVSDVEINPFGPEFGENYIWFYGVLDSKSRQIVASTQDFRMDSACPAVNGRMLFSNGAGSDSYYLKDVAVESNDGRLLLPPRRVGKSLGTSSASSLSCSSDGAMAVAVLSRGQPDVYTADLNSQDDELSNIHRLTSSSSQDYPHAWTPDSRAVVFESERRGNYGIFKQALNQPSAESIVNTPGQEVLPQVTPDGRWVLYAWSAGDAPAGIRTLMRVPIGGGQPEPVPIGGALDEFRCPLAGNRGCVLRETIGDREFVYYRLDPLAGKGEELARRKWEPNVLGDWDVSPDGQSLAIPSHNPADARVLILPLQGSAREAKPREIVFKDVGTLWSSVWRADGRGLFITAKDGTGATLLSSTLDGRICVLRRMKVPTLAVPSPDGKHLAFWDHTSNENVWRVR